MSDGGGRDADFFCEVGVNKDLCGSKSQSAYKTIKLSQVMDSDDVSDVALKVGCDIAGVEGVEIHFGIGPELGVAALQECVQGGGGWESLFDFRHKTGFADSTRRSAPVRLSVTFSMRVKFCDPVNRKRPCV